MAVKRESKTLERIYTIPLRASYRNAPPYRKTNRAVIGVRSFLERHMKATNIRLGQHLNALLWARGIKSPPPRVTVKAVKDEEGVVRAELEGRPYKESIKPNPKEEAPSTLKEKLTSSLGGKKREKAEQSSRPEKPTPAKKEEDQKNEDASRPQKPMPKKSSGTSDEMRVEEKT